MGIWFSLDSTVLPPTLRMDGMQYIAIAEDPRWFFCVGGMYAQRVLPPMIVWAESRLFGLSTVLGFRLICAVSYCSFLCLFYRTLRNARTPLPIATGTTLFCAICYWPMTYSLGNVYQACDAMAYPMALIMVTLAMRRRLLLLCAVSALAIMVRQQLFLLAIFALADLYLETRSRKVLAGMVFLLVVLGLLLQYAGVGRGVRGLVGVCRAIDWGAVPRAVIETRMPVILTPFLLLPVLFPKRVGGYVKKYWWAALYATATMAQPVLMFPVSGASNAQRLAMIGAWLAFLLAGLLLRDALRRRWAMWTYAALPLLYGTKHLTHLKHTYPCLIGHRSVMNVVILLLVAAEIWWLRRRSEARVGSGIDTVSR